MFMLRVADGEELKIDWNFQFEDYPVATNPLLNKMEASFFLPGE